MPNDQESRINEIRKRVEEYHKHENDSYAYSPGEIKAVREFNAHALEDVEFFLAQVKKTNLPWQCRTFGHVHAVVRPDLRVEFLEHCRRCGEPFSVNAPYQGDKVLRCKLFGHKHITGAGGRYISHKKRCFRCHFNPKS